MKPAAHSDSRILLFARAPEHGKVKTRLARAIGNDDALALYRRFTADLVAMLTPLPFDLSIFFHPAKGQKMVKDWLGDANRLYAQKGQDLGERMANAFRQAFAEGAQQALLLGTDIPDLPARFILEGFEQLHRNDAVIGPAADGGYFLIGFQRQAFHPGWFTQIDWGSVNVLQTQIKKITQDHKSVYRLPQWPDIDEIDDLREFWRKNRDHPQQAPRTINYIRQNTALTQKLVSF